MRPVYCALLLLLAARSAYPGSGATVVLQFEHRYSDISIGEMKTEAQKQMPATVLNWRLASKLSSSESFSRLIVVKLRGACETRLPAPPESGGEPLAYTYVSGGAPMPFADIECDRVRGALREPGDLLLGRALGRVLAHELYHIIGQTVEHTPTGCRRKSLSPRDLAADLISK